MKILFLPKYSIEGASSRYRIYQYLEFYNQNNIQSHVSPFFNSSYIYNFEKGNRILNMLHIPFNIVRRICILFTVPIYDIVYIEKELIPYCPPLFEFLLKIFHVKYILDYDDAIFHNYDNSQNIILKILLKNKIPSIIASASGVITGSPYLTEFALRYNANVCEIPTSVDLRKYRNEIYLKRQNFTIGWIGGRSTSSHLVSILPALNNFVKSHSNCIIKLIGFDEKLFSTLNLSNNFLCINWDENKEVQDLHDIDIGIMPLTNDIFAKGKCGFKLIQYMSCSKPTISTPFQANIKIDSDNGNLFADNLESWEEQLNLVMNNMEDFIIVGEKNRQTVIEKYSIQSNFSEYINLINKVMEKPS